MADKTHTAPMPLGWRAAPWTSSYKYVKLYVCQVICYIIGEIDYLTGKVIYLYKGRIEFIYFFF
jgi:hypothetical protein